MKMRIVFGIVFLVMSQVWCLGAIGAVPAIDLTGNLVTNELVGFVHGWEFTLGDKDLEVTDLGIWDDVAKGGDAGFTSDYDIAIYEKPSVEKPSGTMVASATLTDDHPSVDTDSYAWVSALPISPATSVVLTKGTTYVVACLPNPNPNPNLSDSTLGDATFIPNLNIVYNESFRFYAEDGLPSTWSYINTDPPITHFFTVNFKFNVVTEEPPVSISGTITSGGSGLSGVTVSANNGGGSVTTDGSGNYSLTVSYGWSGVVTPSLTGYTFSPVNKSYMNVTSNQPEQNYTAEQTPTPIDVDIWPNTNFNCIDQRYNYLVPVAILTDGDFNAETVDPTTINLSGANVAKWGRHGTLLYAIFDVDCDGDNDLVFLVWSKDIILPSGEGDAILTAKTYGVDPLDLWGKDDVTIIK